MFESISENEARLLAIRAQHFQSDRPNASLTASAFALVEKLSYLQIDSLNVVQRAHHHTLWSRLPDYRPDILDHLHAGKREVFEYWAHASAYLPISHYRYYLPRMKNFREKKNKWVQQLYELSGHLVAPALERIREEGPLRVKDFQKDKELIRDPWGAIKKVKFALDLLFWRGDLMISERRNFQKVYDLTERVLPPGTDLTWPDEQELGHFLVSRAVASLGIARKKDILTFLQPNSGRDSAFRAAEPHVANRVFLELLEAGEILKVRVEGNEGDDCFAGKTALLNLSKVNPASDGLHLLSPFDNLFTFRERLKWLFHFDLSLECYLPPSKRTFGYFVVPVLWQGRVVGRLDPKADRKERILHINAMEVFDSVEKSDQFLAAFSKKIEEFARFNGCDHIRYHPAVQKPLRNALPVKVFH